MESFALIAVAQYASIGLRQFAWLRGAKVKNLVLWGMWLVEEVAKDPSLEYDFCVALAESARLAHEHFHTWVFSGDEFHRVDLAGARSATAPPGASGNRFRH